VVPEVLEVVVMQAQLQILMDLMELPIPAEAEAAHLGTTILETVILPVAQADQA
jgi:hypothetical protein